MFFNCFYLCLFVHSGVQHILGCVFVLLVYLVASFFELISYLRYLCLLAYSCVHHISSCVPSLPVSLDCPFLIVPSGYSLTFTMYETLHCNIRLSNTNL
jgi:hypothetical protein